MLTLDHKGQLQNGGGYMDDQLEDEYETWATRVSSLPAGRAGGAAPIRFDRNGYARPAGTGATVSGMTSYDGEVARMLESMRSGPSSQVPRSRDSTSRLLEEQARILERSRQRKEKRKGHDSNKPIESEIWDDLSASSANFRASIAHAYGEFSAESRAMSELKKAKVSDTTGESVPSPISRLRRSWANVAASKSADTRTAETATKLWKSGLLGPTSRTLEEQATLSGEIPMDEALSQQQVPIPSQAPKEATLTAAEGRIEQGADADFDADFDVTVGADW